MKYRITLNLDTRDTRSMRIEAKHEYIDEEVKDWLEEIYLTIFKSCKKADKRAFYNAFAKFAEEDFDDAKKFIEEEMQNEN